MYDDPTTSSVFYRNQLRRYPIVESGEGIYLYDRAGKRYVDALGGAGVVSIGHGVEEVLEAMQRQAGRVCFAYTNHFTSDAQMALADVLTSLAPEALTKAFFVSGGAEATEAALKIARQYFVETGRSSKYKAIGRWGSFHGNTLGALSMSGRIPWKEIYGPLLLDFAYIAPCHPYRCTYCQGEDACNLRCAEELEQTIAQEGPDTVAAFIADPIVGSSLAVATPPPDYFPLVREICDRYDVLLIADEVLTGFGRTGRNFALDHWNVVPDLIACGKGISSGYTPLGAVLASDDISRAFRGGSGAIMHGHTYGGNPLACAVGLAVQEYLQERDLFQRSAVMGDYLYERASRLTSCSSVGDVRGGKGLFLGVEFVEDKSARRPYPREMKVAETVLEIALEMGMTLFAGAGGAHGDRGDCVMIAPPFIVSREDVDEIVDLLEAVIKEAESRLIRVHATGSGRVSETLLG